MLEVAAQGLFSPMTESAYGSMGLFQRSFVGLLRESSPRLEVAFVVDATHSMEPELAGLKRALPTMLDELRRFKGDHLRLQLVVFRDSGAKDRIIETPFQDFVDQRQFKAEFDKITTATGEPYFYEAVDLALAKAFELTWSTDDSSRWVVLIGDAPPYAPGFSEPRFDAGRKVHDDVLIETATRNGLRVSCILCRSRETERKTQDRVLAEARAFMSRLASETHGRMLDLSYGDVEKKLQEIKRIPPIHFTEIPSIDRSEILRARTMFDWPDSAVGPLRRIRIAVLPPKPVTAQLFDGEDAASRLATEIQLRLREMNGIETATAVELLNAVANRSLGISTAENSLAKVCEKVRAEYVVWGKVRGDQTNLTLHDRDGKEIANYTAKEPKELLRGLFREALKNVDVEQHHKRLAQILKFPPPEFAITERPDVQQLVLDGMMHLERSLDVDRPIVAELSKASDLLGKAVREEPDNPFILDLFASCRFNEWQHAFWEGRTQEAETLSRQYRSALQRAHKNLRNGHPQLSKEIEADYFLLINRDVKRAVALYQELTGIRNTIVDQGSIAPATALRAHWMLAGIHSGDWGVDASFVQPSIAKQHLIHILAHWGNSPEALAIRRELQWSDDAERTLYTYVPLRHASLAGK